MELISRWEDFGMRYRAEWRPDAAYDEKDVVFVYIDDYEGCFVCKTTHIAEGVSPEQCPDQWEEWNRDARLRKMTRRKAT